MGRGDEAAQEIVLSAGGNKVAQANQRIAVGRSVVNTDALELPFEPRHYQLDTFSLARKKIAPLDKGGEGWRSILIQAATGAGKTVIATMIAKSAYLKGARTLFLVDRTELRKQSIATFERAGIPTSIMQGTEPGYDRDAPMQVCMQQTLRNRIKNKSKWGPDKYPVQIIIIDECHDMYGVQKEVAALYPNAIIIGLTATPFSKNLGVMYDGMISVIAMQTLIDEGFLTQYEVYAPKDATPNFKGVKTKANGDLDDKAMSEKYNDQIVGDVIERWEKHCKGQTTVGFAANVTESKRWAEAFCREGYQFRHIDGYDQTKEGKARRAEILKQLHHGEIDGVFCVAVLTKGWDEDAVSCMIDVAPTRSRKILWQRLGRLLRPNKDYPVSTVLDHAGNFRRVGFPELFDMDSFELDKGQNGNKKDRKSKDAAEPVECKACKRLYPPTFAACPHCNEVPERKPISPNKQESDLAYVDGELVKLEREQPKKKEKKPKAERQVWYSALITLIDIENAKRQRKGKKPYAANYATVLYREKFDSWPNDLQPIPGLVTIEAQNYLKHRRISYAKAQASKKNAA